MSWLNKLLPPKIKKDSKKPSSGVPEGRAGGFQRPMVRPRASQRDSVSPPRRAASSLKPRARVLASFSERRRASYLSVRPTAPVTGPVPSHWLTRDLLV